jgi:hypothetical protein
MLLSTGKSTIKSLMASIIRRWASAPGPEFQKDPLSFWNSGPGAEAQRLIMEAMRLLIVDFPVDSSGDAKGKALDKVHCHRRREDEKSCPLSVTSFQNVTGCFNDAAVHGVYQELSPWHLRYRCYHGDCVVIFGISRSACDEHPQ